MSEYPLFYTDHRAIDLSTDDLVQRLEGGVGPVTMVHDAGEPRYVILSIEVWELLGKVPLSKAMNGDAETVSPSALPITHPNYRPEHKRARRLRNLLG